jgi:RNA polymerase sigma-70 factor (ECF subfamily)
MRGTMASNVLAGAVILADRKRMDWKEQASANEVRLRSQLLKALAGDSVAYEQFLIALGSHLRPFFRKRLSQLPDEVEDLVQETLLGVHTHRHTYESSRPLTAWVYAIARYKLVDFLRSRSRRDALNDPLDEDLQVFAQTEVEAVEAQRDLETLLQTLPERQRLALKMVKVEGASVADTAVSMGMSQVAVKVGVHRSLKALAARFRGKP